MMETTRQNTEAMEQNAPVNVLADGTSWYDIVIFGTGFPAVAAAAKILHTEAKSTVAIVGPADGMRYGTIGTTAGQNYWDCRLQKRETDQPFLNTLWQHGTFYDWFYPYRKYYNADQMAEMIRHWYMVPDSPEASGTNPRLTEYLQQDITAVHMAADGKRIESIKCRPIERNSSGVVVYTGAETTIYGTVFIDASEDGKLARLADPAGVTTGRYDWNPAYLTPEEREGDQVGRQPAATLMFKVKNVRIVKPDESIYQGGDDIYRTTFDYSSDGIDGSPAAAGADGSRASYTDNAHITAFNRKYGPIPGDPSLDYHGYVMKPFNAAQDGPQVGKTEEEKEWWVNGLLVFNVDGRAHERDRLANNGLYPNVKFGAKNTDEAWIEARNFLKNNKTEFLDVLHRFEGFENAVFVEDENGYPVTGASLYIRETVHMSTTNYYEENGGEGDYYQVAYWESLGAGKDSTEGQDYGNFKHRIGLVMYNPDIHPYRYEDLLDENGHFLWFNDDFCKMRPDLVEKGYLNPDDDRLPLNPAYYPYEGLLSHNVSNLLIPGYATGCCSVSWGEVRVLSNLCVLGDAAGIAAQYCVETGKAPKALDDNDIAEVQNRLKSVGARLDKEDDWNQHPVVASSGGGVIGRSANATSGGAVGRDTDTVGGGAVGYYANSQNGGAIGSYSSSRDGGAVGFQASSTLGGAVGYKANVLMGGAVGNESSAEDGGAIGHMAKTVKGGAAGYQAVSNRGGAVGYNAKETSYGGAVGENATVSSGGAIGLNAEAQAGGSVGAGASAFYGGAVGAGTTTGDGGAIGWEASATGGGAAGNHAGAGAGGAVGSYAVSGDGFAGGKNAKTVNAQNNSIDAVQLGTGTNSASKTLQVYSKRIVEADGSLTDVGRLNALATTQKDNIVSAINELRDSIGGGGSGAATVVIGTSTQGHTLADCDYLCDGTDDQEEIQQAIFSLWRHGGKIYILEGRYHLSGSVSIYPSNITIEGCGSGTRLVRMYNSADERSAMLSLCGAYNFTKIKNLFIDGNKSNYSGEYNTGIYFESGKHCEIANNFIINCAKNGIRIDQDYNNVHDNYIDGCNIAIDAHRFHNGRICGNITNNTASAGISLQGSYNNVYGNTTNRSKKSIYVKGNCNTISGNNMGDISDGMYMEDADFNTITGNSMHDITGQNYEVIYLSASNNNTIAGNVFDSIYIYSSSSHNIVLGNHSYLSDSGTDSVVEHNIDY